MYSLFLDCRINTKYAPENSRKDFESACLVSNLFGKYTHGFCKTKYCTANNKIEYLLNEVCPGVPETNYFTNLLIFIQLTNIDKIE